MLISNTYILLNFPLSSEIITKTNVEKCFLSTFLQKDVVNIFGIKTSTACGAFPVPILMNESIE